MAESSSVREDVPATDRSEVAESKVADNNNNNKNDNTNPGVSRNSSSSQSGSGSVPELVVSEEAEAVLKMLAQQVEYYFSSTNLSKDTYVSTLRSLNDGYVPISIIANFGKVRALVPYDSINAVKKAASEYSELLEVVRIDTSTGKRSEHGDADSGTLEAVGPIGGQPLNVSTATTAVSKQASPTPRRSSNPSVQNTIILREVPSSVQEQDVRQLFSFENCPPVKSLRLDVANCWFVTLDTTSRDDMVNVMFSLRSMKFSSGEPVMARLKSGIVMGDVPAAPLTVSSNSLNQVPPYGSGSPRYYNGSQQGRKNKKKNNKNSPKNKNGSSNYNNNNNNHNSNNSSISNNNNNSNFNSNSRNRNNNHRRNNAASRNKKANADKTQQGRMNNGNGAKSNTAKTTAAATTTTRTATTTESVPTTPPQLGEEQFPALPSDELIAENKNKIEVEKVPEDRLDDDLSEEELHKKGAMSDGASTATTSSSSSSSKPNQSGFGGYAAALLKAAPKQPDETSRPAKVQAKTNNKKHSEKKKPVETVEHVEEKDIPKSVPKQEVESPAENAPAVMVKPPTWGGGRSFADVLRKESAIEGEVV